MLRSIKSGQRKVRILSFKLTSGEVSGLDAKKVSVVGGNIVFKDVFASAPDLAVGVGTSTASGITSPTDGQFLVIGSDTAERY
jgi:hypothetical protein